MAGLAVQNFVSAGRGLRGRALMRASHCLPMLITRGSLTTFSIANDVAKYFRDPAGPVRGVAYPGLEALNIMRLGSARVGHPVGGRSTHWSFVALVPLALRGVRYRPSVRPGAAPAETAHLRPRPGDPVRRHQNSSICWSSLCPGIG
jgi:hypothetical protein